ncbi:MAG: hypothetical protein JNK15_01860, partial [Planctomycetes bacterium]|nr:hypothetical protein [Planctomycetota bacterium]
VQNYGLSSCPGSGNRTPRIAANSLPTIGNGAFTLGVDNALPGTIAVCGIALAPSAIVIDGCRVLLGLPFTTLPAVVTSAAGTATSPLPIPANPALDGVQLFAQYAVFDPNGPFLGEMALSDGLRLRLGN